ncbi:MAG: hypothetical protein M1826_006534 [Phylliscum demangeonii]|nr:MAG: hypothetical protein M1826_006534 [Phylliscum demangeonii]
MVERPEARGAVRIGSADQYHDVLARLGPSLARHANCDIIDLNPGIGIWSTAVHEIVKPRTHILVEPEEKYMPFLRPLLERAGSRYRLYAPRFIMNDNFRDLARADYLSGQQRLRPGDPGHANRNDTLLLIGNMGEFRPKAHYLFPRYKTLMMYHMVKAVRTQVDLSSYGLVRMLLWMSEQEKRTLLPRSIVLRKRSQIEAEMNMEYVHEIAGTDGTLNKGKRPDDFELSQTVQVVKGMAERGVDTPLHRKLDSQREAEMFLATGAGSASAGLGDGIRRAWQDELLALDQAVQDGRLQASSRKEGDPIYARYRYLRQWAGQMRNKKQQVDTVIDLACGPVHDGPSGGASSRRVLTDAGSVAKLRQHVDKLGYLERGMVFTVLDEHLGRQRQPPLLMWDRRLDHPLAVHVEDFFPHEPLTLIDMQPRAMPALLTQDAAAQEVYEYLLSGLFRHGRLSFPDALEALAPNSFDGVAMHVPLLRDPAQGGYPDLHMMRPRTLSPEMLLAMVEAWQRWPFRPPRRRLLRSMVDSLADTALDLDEWKW